MKIQALFFNVRFLFVFATSAEARAFINLLNEKEDIHQENSIYFKNKNEIVIGLSGIGLAISAVNIAGFLHKHKPDVAIQAGLAGSYNRYLELGTIGQVMNEYMPEAGADSPEGFIPLYQMKIAPEAGYYCNAEGINNNNSYNPEMFSALPLWNSNSVNTVSGNKQKITELLKRAPAQVENMEGASFFLACNKANVQYAQIRAISNYVEDRNPLNWQIETALNNLSFFLDKFVQSL